jgi:glyoxylase-like metal-dependent hydrolase (beta-lactamase superfamily II)
MKMIKRIQILTLLLVIAACQSEQGTPYVTAGTFAEICEGLPREENAKLPLSEVSDDWFQVYEVSEGVYSIVEPYQFQQTISHLIVGENSAVLFDTGIGLLPIRPVVERITSLPVSVLNSHTHYDHVGGNAEFSSVLAIDSEYTRANMAGFEHSRIAEDFMPDAFCNGPPEGVDVAAFYTKPWKASRFVEDGEILDLGGRTLKVLHVPGHTPDATALLDAENGLLFTGDSFYDAELWLFVPETSLDDYDRTISRLASLESNIKYLLGAHNSARVDAGRLSHVEAAFHQLRSGRFTGDEESGNRLMFLIDGVEFVTSQQVLDGEQGDLSKGGSGLDTWP